jgi:hypothetical protein
MENPGNPIKLDLKFGFRRRSTHRMLRVCAVRGAKTHLTVHLSTDGELTLMSNMSDFIKKCYEALKKVNRMPENDSGRWLSSNC